MLLNLAFLKTICLFSRNFCRSFVYIYKIHIAALAVYETPIYLIYTEKNSFLIYFVGKKWLLFALEL